MNIKFIASLVGAAGAGATVAWAITADRAEERARRMAEDYISLAESTRTLVSENIRLSAEHKIQADLIDKLEHKLLGDPDVSVEESKRENPSLKELADAIPEEAEPTEQELEAQRTDLRNLIAPYIGSPEAQEAFAETARIAVEAAQYDPPMVISQADFSHDEEGAEYAKHTIHFYQKDQTLLDENDEIVPQDEVEGYVGWRSLRRFGDKSGQPDVVYVRNRRLDIDFEVVLLEDDELPLHVKYGMSQPEFDTMKRSGKLRLPSGEGDDG